MLICGRLAVASATSGSDQYRPGNGFGDKNHNHTGPPGQKRAGGAFAPPLTVRCVGATAGTALLGLGETPGLATVSEGKAVVLDRSSIEPAKGVIPSLALGIWLGSSPSLPFSEWRENVEGEAFYQGRPVSSCRSG